MGHQDAAYFNEVIDQVTKIEADRLGLNKDHEVRKGGSFSEDQKAEVEKKASATWAGFFVSKKDGKPQRDPNAGA